MKIQAEIRRRRWMKLCEALPVAILALLAPIWVSGQGNVETIIQKSVEANNRDWDADPEFDYTERDQEKDGIKTYEVRMLYGSPYRKRDHTMLDQLTKAFDFRLLGNKRLKGHSVYVLSA
jgi:hypothetical protein